MLVVTSLTTPSKSHEIDDSELKIFMSEAMVKAVPHPFCWDPSWLFRQLMLAFDPIEVEILKLVEYVVRGFKVMEESNPGDDPPFMQLKPAPTPAQKPVLALNDCESWVIVAIE